MSKVPERSAKHAIAAVTRFDTAPLRENKPNDISLTLALDRLGMMTMDWHADRRWRDVMKIQMGESEDI